MEKVNQFLAETNAIWKIEESKENLKKEYSVNVPYNTFVQWAQIRAASKVVPGFRQGKAPLSTFKDDWFLACTREVAYKIVKEDKIDKIWNTSYSVQKFEVGQEIKFKLIFDLFPEMPKIDFDKIELIKNTAKINNADAKKAIENFLKSRFKAVELKEQRKIEIGDFLNVSIEIENKEGKKEKLQKLDIQLGKRILLPEIEEQLIGKMLNDSITHSFQIPESGTLIKDKKLIGKEITVFLTVNEVKGAENITIEDALKEFNVDSEEKLEEKFLNSLKQEAEHFSTYLLKEELKNELMKNQFEIHKDLILQKYHGLKSQILSDIEYKEGDNLEELVKEKLQLSLEDFEKRTIIIAESIARLSFILMTISKEMQIKVEQQEIEHGIDQQKRFFSNNLEEAKKFFNENKEAKHSLIQTILESKTLEALIPKCKLTIEEHEIKDFYNLKPKHLSTQQDQPTKKEEKIKKPSKKVNN